MFHPAVTHEQREAAVRGLSGRVIQVLVQDCVRGGDLAGLQTIEAAGHFDVGQVDDVWAVPQKDQHGGIRHGVADVHALPMIDALAAVLCTAWREPVIYPTPCGPAGPDMEGDMLRLRVDPGVAAFVRDRCLRDMDELDDISSRLQPVGLITPPFEVTRHATAGVVAAIGCALDDVMLLERAQRSAPDVLWRMLHGDGIAHAMNGWSATPLALAMSYGSLRVLQRVPAELVHDVERPVALAPKNGGKRKIPGSQLIVSSADHTELRQPEVIAWAIARLLECEPQDDPASQHPTRAMRTAWISYLFGGGWSHARRHVMDQAPAFVDRDLGLAMVHGLRAGMQDVVPELMGRYRGAFGPPAQLPPGEEFVLDTKHPVGGVYATARTMSMLKEIAVTDHSLLMVLQEIERRGALEQLLDPRIRLHCERSNRVMQLPHALASAGLARSIVFLADRGMDTDLRDERGALPVELVPDNDTGQQVGNALRALGARRQALIAVGEACPPAP